MHRGGIQLVRSRLSPLSAARGDTGSGWWRDECVHLSWHELFAAPLEEHLQTPEGRPLAARVARARLADRMAVVTTTWVNGQAVSGELQPTAGPLDRVDTRGFPAADLYGLTQLSAEDAQKLGKRVQERAGAARKEIAAKEKAVYLKVHKARAAAASDATK